jgi:hypothetical protein
VGERVKADMRIKNKSSEGEGEGKGKGALKIIPLRAHSLAHSLTHSFIHPSKGIIFYCTVAHTTI